MGYKNNKVYAVIEKSNPNIWKPKTLPPPKKTARPIVITIYAFYRIILNDFGDTKLQRKSCSMT